VVLVPGRQPRGAGGEYEMVPVDGGGHDDALRPPCRRAGKRLTDAVEQAYRNARRPIDGLGASGAQ
jgi:hypothetical protein